MEEFINDITDQIRCARARKYVAKELSDHILDQAAAYERKGVEHDEAVRMSVQGMGDPVKIGTELDRIHRPQTDVRMIWMVLVFSFGGMLLQYILPGNLPNASVTNGSRIFLGQFGRQCVILMIAFGVMAGMYFLDYSIIGRYAVTVYVSMTIVFLVVSQILPTVNGRIAFMFMPVYLYIPAYVGILYKMRGKGYGAIVQSVVVQLLTAVLVKDLANTLLAMLTVYLIQTVILILAIYKNWFKVNTKITIVGIIALLVILPAVGTVIRMAGNPHSFTMGQVRAWLNPSADPQGFGYIYIFIRNELAHVRMIGASDSSVFLKEGAVLWMGEKSDPFIFLQLICTYGVLAGVIVILAFAAMLVRICHITIHQKNQLGFMVSAACFMVFLFNCAEGLLINSGYFLVTSMQFPFLSSGVGATITYAVFIGLMLSVYRNESVITDDTVIDRLTWKLSVKLERKGSTLQ